MSFMRNSLTVLVVLMGCSHVIDGISVPQNLCLNTYFPLSYLYLYQIVGDWYISATLSGSPLDTGTSYTCSRVSIFNVYGGLFDICVSITANLLGLGQIYAETCGTATATYAFDYVDRALFLLSNVVSTSAQIYWLPIQGLLGIHATDYVNYLVLSVCSLVDYQYSVLILTRYRYPSTYLIKTALSASGLGLTYADFVFSNCVLC